MAPRKPTGLLIALALPWVVVAAACTDGDAGRTGSTTQPTTSVVPTPAETFTGAPGSAAYTYANGALVVTLELDGSSGTLVVDNGSEHDLGRPGLYVLDAVDGHETAGQVLAPAPVAAGERATFEITLPGLGVDDIGLLVLLFGEDNFGAFVRTA